MPLIDGVALQGMHGDWAYSGVFGTFVTRMTSSTDDTTYGYGSSSQYTNAVSVWLPGFNFDLSGEVKLWIRARYTDSSYKQTRVLLAERNGYLFGTTIRDSATFNTTSSFASYSFTLTTAEKEQLLAVCTTNQNVGLRAYAQYNVQVSQVYLEVPYTKLGIEMGCVF